ncbi:Transcription factor 25 [Mortierella alpina]|uniref:Transcription factor 25 n=1 Tax=Mortierella alpina TaxID=64518 RepID=A0A9P6JAJ4_MORAP|nr:Transcription factor 25 [Mortierella alpina]
MSSRAMKKLLRDSNGPAPLREREHTHAPKDTQDTQDHHREDHDDTEEEEDEDEDDSLVTRRPPARNLFALLDEDDEEVAQSDEEEEEQDSIPAPVATKSSKKKKNKKKKSAASVTANPFSALKDEDDDPSAKDTQSSSPVEPADAEDGTTSAKSKNKSKKKKKGKAVSKTLEEMSIEEFEKSLQQMNQQLGSMTSTGESSRGPSLAPLKQLLAVDTRFLDADAEMKKMFGARVVNSEIKDRRYAKVNKKALLAQPRGTWPVRKASGLSMEIVDTDEKEHVTTFKVVHSDYYQRTQLKFLAAVASYDPGNLVALLRESPFHIDSLLQLSEVSKHNGDNSLAGEFIEQALFAFEKSFHSLFNIASGSVRLSFMEVENRSFFLAIHRHIQFLGRRGCWRTAFEFNKLLLSLDPEHDELGALLSIDFYSLKAQEYTYLLKLYERLQKEHGLDQLPNFAYSTALAKFHLETSQGNTTHEESSRALQRAILLFPTAVPLLADQGSFSVDSEIAGEASFYPTSDLPKILDLYIHLFVSRNFALWKEPEVISWLKSNVQICVQSRFQNTHDKDLQDAQALLQDLSTPSPAKSAVLSYSPDGTLESDSPTSSSSATSDPRISLRVCRHVLVSDFNALARYLPQEIVTATMHMHDPLPPAGSRNVYEERFEAQRSSGGLMGGARDAAQGLLENVIRQLRAGGLPGIGGGGGGAGGEGAAGLDGLGGAGGLQEEQLRQITEAVQMLRARHQAHARDGALPGAFPDDQMPLAATADGAGVARTAGAAGAAATMDVVGQDDAGEHGVDAEGEDRLEAESAGNATVFQSLSEMMRLLGFGPRNAAGGDAAAGPAGAGGVEVDGLPLTQEETDELVAAMVMNNLAQGGFGSEDGEEGEEDEDYSEDEDQPFGPDGDDGWEPYDPAAYS